MLRTLLVTFGVLAVLCNGGTDGETEWEGSPGILDLDGSCDEEACTWAVQADGPTGTVELSIVATGDPGWEEDCADEMGAGGLLCGAWSEYHDAFALIESGEESETKAITLVLVDSFDDQVGNESTLFDLSDAATEEQLTVLVSITDENGRAADCVVAGHDPTWFADRCTNEIEGW